MRSRSPLVGPALGFVAGIALGLRGTSAPSGILLTLPLALSPPLAPIALCAAGWTAAGATAVAAVAPPTGPTVVAGRVASVPERSADRVRFRIRTPAGDAFDAFAPPSPWPLALGDLVRMDARLRVPPRPLNPGGRDVASRLAASGIALQAIAVGPVIRTASPSPLAWLEHGRERLGEAADRVLPAREAGLVRAIATGDRSALDVPTTLSFARSGLAHVLAVSGLHLVVVALGLERLLRAVLLRVEQVAARVDPRRLSAAVALPVTAAYALATGAGVPVLRAAISAAVGLVGALLDRETSAANALALAGLVLLAGDPGAVLDVSLQLSFAAVAGLALWAGPLRRALPVARPRPGTWQARLVEPFVAGVCATVAASIATAPVLAFHFRQLPLLGLAANVAGVPIGSALTALGAVAAVAAAVGEPLAMPVLLAARPFATALLRLSDAAAAPRWSVLGVGSPGVAGACGALVAAALSMRVRGWRRVACWAAAAAFLFLPPAARALAARARGGLEVTFLSVGQGDSALLRLPDGSAVLVDAGGAPDGGADPGARDIVPLLRDLGVRRLAAVFVSHPHPDHVLGLAAVAAAFPIERVFSNGDAGDGTARDVLASLRPVTLAPGDVRILAGVRFEVHGGPRETFAANDASLVLRVVHGSTAFLFPGDIEAPAEADAVAHGGLAADVVKVPHHGSRTSSTAPFVAAVGPRFAAVSVGRDNRFGFPHDEAVARWRAAGATLLRTDEGAIRFLSDGQSVRRVPADAVLDPLAIWRERAHATEVRMEDIDLMALAERLREKIPPTDPPVGYLRGRSYFRDLVQRELGCSDLEAEELVDTLELNGYLKFKGDPSVRSRAESRWDVDPHIP